MDNTHTINHFMAGIAPAGDVCKGTKGTEGQPLHWNAWRPAMCDHRQ